MLSGIRCFLHNIIMAKERIAPDASLGFPSSEDCGIFQRNPGIGNQYDQACFPPHSPCNGKRSPLCSFPLYDFFKRKWIFLSDYLEVIFLFPIFAT